MWTPTLKDLHRALLLLSFPALSQNLDVTVIGGGGIEAVSGITAVGASIGGPHISKHRLQLDYLFHNGYSRDERQRHLLTFSYVRQARSGRTRGFFSGRGRYCDAPLSGLEPLAARQPRSSKEKHYRLCHSPGRRRDHRRGPVVLHPA